MKARKSRFSEEKPVKEITSSEAAFFPTVFWQYSILYFHKNTYKVDRIKILPMNFKKQIHNLNTT